MRRVFSLGANDKVIMQTERDKRHWMMMISLIGLTAILVSLASLRTVFQFVPRRDSLQVFIPFALVLMLFSLLVLLRLHFRSRMWRLTETALERGRPVNLRIPLAEIESIRIGIPARFPYLLQVYKEAHIGGWRNMMLKRRHAYVLTLKDGRFFTLELSHIPNGSELMRALRRQCYSVLDPTMPPIYTDSEAHVLRWGRVNRFHRRPKNRCLSHEQGTTG